MSAADGLEPAMRAAIWRTLIGLLAVTGLRQGEACRLERDDIDLEAATLVIAGSKFGKSRQVFLHPTTVVAPRAYERTRNRVFPEPGAGTFLVNSRGEPLDGHNIQHTFAVLIATASLSEFPCKQRIADVVILSQRKPPGEEDSQRVQGHRPAVRSRPGLASSLT